MSELASLQRAFASGLLGQDDAILGHIQPGRFAPDALLQIYRNNFILGLTEVLASSYPAVRAMVGETFFEAAARGFVLAAPLEEGSVMDYGEGFGGWCCILPAICNSWRAPIRCWRSGRWPCAAVRRSGSWMLSAPWH
ncbi:DNA-binding domain-containing protein [Aeromonas caviae]|nr:DNA-binding domain-containing protein [Aeromonas caviae]WDV29496.1 DNA-binding domain-containing protein [Aeromonas caviae]